MAGAEAAGGIAAAQRARSAVCGMAGRRHTARAPQSGATFLDVVTRPGGRYKVARLPRSRPRLRSHEGQGEGVQDAVLARAAPGHELRSVPALPFPALPWCLNPIKALNPCACRVRFADADICHVSATRSDWRSSKKNGGGPASFVDLCNNAAWTPLCRHQAPKSPNPTRPDECRGSSSVCGWRRWGAGPDRLVQGAEGGARGVQSTRLAGAPFNARLPPSMPGAALPRSQWCSRPFPHIIRNYGNGITDDANVPPPRALAAAARARTQHVGFLFLPNASEPFFPCRRRMVLLPKTRWWASTHRNSA
jgi:hypothetical protein